jgi:D-serine dehydratase
MPIPIKQAKTGSRAIEAVPATWKVVSLNDQHGYLRWQPEDQGEAPVVGDKIGLGISHPCTTFDKWQWMPIVNDDYDVVDAITTNF